MNQWMDLAERVLDGAEVTNQEALAILNCPDDDLLLLMHAAFHIRKRFYGKKVKLNMIMNAKSGCVRKIAGTVHNLQYQKRRLSLIGWWISIYCLRGQNAPMT